MILYSHLLPVYRFQPYTWQPSTLLHTRLRKSLQTHNHGETYPVQLLTLIIHVQIRFWTRLTQLLMFLKTILFLF